MKSLFQLLTCSLLLAGTVLMIIQPVHAGTTFSTGAYGDNQRITDTLSIPDAQGLMIKVSGNTEQGYDFITIYDSSGAELLKLSGNIDEVLSIRGNSINVVFISDGGVTDSGVTVYISKSEILPPVSWRTLSFDHPFDGIVHVPEKKFILCFNRK